VQRETKQALLQAAAVGGAAVAYRVWLSWRYFGWEESDYGNLKNVREVMDSGFTWFNPAYGPGYYSMAGAVRLLVEDPRASALGMTIAFAVVGVVAATMVTRKLAGPSASWLVGAWLVLQPDIALEGASTLRYPVYGALTAVAVAAMVWGRSAVSVGAAGLGAMVHPVAWFNDPIPALLAPWVDRGKTWRALLLPAAFLLGLAGLWQLYVTRVFDEGFFITAPVRLNVESDFELRDALERTWALTTWLVPRKLGWTWLVLAAIGAWGALRGVARPGGRTVFLWAFLVVGAWTGMGFLASYDPNHNLFWARLQPVVPLLGILAGIGWAWVSGRLAGAPRGTTAVAWLVVATSVAPSFLAETRYQMDRSERWYRPQLEHSRWVEEHAPPGTGVLTSAIPEVWLTRVTEPAVRVFAFSKLPAFLRDAPPGVVGDWLLAENVRYVWWFREDWTEASVILPSLADGVAVALGDAVAVPLDREDEYGWILYGVHRSGEPPPPAPPPYASGSRMGPGWWK